MGLDWDAQAPVEQHGLTDAYRDARLPLFSGLGGEAPLRGSWKNSAIVTSNVFANRSNTSTVGFSLLPLKRTPHTSGQPLHHTPAAPARDGISP
jgi:hypothetical protein